MKLTKPNVFQNLLDNLGQKIKKKKFDSVLYF